MEHVYWIEEGRLAGRPGPSCRPWDLGELYRGGFRAIVSLEETDPREILGAGFEHLVKINNYLVDIERNMPAFREIRDRYLVKAQPPASTTIGVPALARPGGLFEIEAIAALPPA